MLNVSPLRYRYTQFFVIFMLCSLIYVMAQSIAPGVKNFQDNLYKKDFLIGKANLLRIKIGDRIFSRFLVGKDGWMEYIFNGNIDDFQNVITLKDQKVIGKRLTALNQYLKSQGITLLVVVAPYKSTIYPDKLPEQIKSLSTQTRLDSLITYLEGKNLPVILDLRPALRAARQEHDVYFKTDGHWNGYGAFVAYATIINALKSSYPKLKPYEAADLELVITDPDVRGIFGVMQVDIKEPNLYFAPKQPFVRSLNLANDSGLNQFSSIQDDTLPTLLMFHDSFGVVNLNNYLSMNFGRSRFVHLLSAPQFLSQESIQQFKPNVIIIEIWEGNLIALASYLSNFASE